MKKIITVLLLVVTLIIPQLGCNPQEQNNNQGVSKTSFHLDTVCTITIYTMEGTGAADKEGQEKEALLLITEAFKLCDDYEKLLSKTIEGSDIDRINRAGGSWVSVSDETVALVKMGKEWGDKTEGLFDITIGKATDLWNFHDEDDEGNKVGTIPDDSLLSEAIKHVDYSKIQINGNRIRLADGKMQLDLGGIAKGYIADKVTAFLEEKGVTSGVVNLGGNIVVIGQKGEDLDKYGEAVDFSIGIGSPVSDKGDLLGTLPGSDMTVVTSGTYERYFEADGIKYHHVLDPKTGYPFDTDLLSVTIIGKKGNSALCDVMSTSALALGEEKAIKMIKGHSDVKAVLVNADGKVTCIGVELD